MAARRNGSRSHAHAHKTSHLDVDWLIATLRKTNIHNTAAAAARDGTSRESSTPARRQSHERFANWSQVLCEDPPLKGTIAQKSIDSACIFYEKLKIFVERRSVFIDSKPCSSDQFVDLVSSGENIVKFEAVFLDVQSRSSERKVGCTHEATCAWLGVKPSLKDFVGSSLQPNRSLLDNPKRSICGLVTRLYLPQTALIYVEGSTVCLHVAACKGTRKCVDQCASGKEYITDFVTLNSSVEFKVKISDDASILEAFDVKVRQEPYALNQIQTSGSLARGICIPQGKLKAVAPKPDSDAEANADAGCALYARSPFYKRWPSQSRQFMLDFSGVLRLDEACEMQVECDVGRSSSLRSRLVYGFNDNRPICRAFDGTPIRFDAEVVESLGLEMRTFHVTRMWTPGSNRPSAAPFLMSDLAFRTGSKMIDRMTYYDGVIKSIPYHDCALAEVIKCLVLVPLDSLFARKYNPCYETIDRYLKAGDSISVILEETRYPDSGSSFLQASKCFLLEKLSTETATANQYVYTTRTRQSGESPASFSMWVFEESSGVIKEGKTWYDNWSLGECYRTSTLRKIYARYCVSFQSSKREHLTLTLDLLKSKGFFVDGIRTDPNKIHDGLVGRQVTFHVHHIYPKRLTNSHRGMFLGYCWIGDEPSVFTLMKDELLVPKGLVSSNSTYECVLKYFALPWHAVCHIGVVPVLLPLERVEENGVFIRPNTDLRCKEVLLVRVEEVSAGNETFLVASEPKRTFLWTDILRDVTGTVVSLPNPSGVIRIKSSSIEVAFEMCHVHDCSPPLKDWCAQGYLQQIYDFKKLIKVGTEVRLTAFKRSDKAAPYRAIEVRLVTSS